jgi:hypothetical protein
MTARELITKTATDAGFENKSSDSESRYFSVDHWKNGKAYLRVSYDVQGRVRAASWGYGSKTRNFIGKGLKDKIAFKLAELSK